MLSETPLEAAAFCKHSRQIRSRCSQSRLRKRSEKIWERFAPDVLGDVSRSVLEAFGKDSRQMLSETSLEAFWKHSGNICVITLSETARVKAFCKQEKNNDGERAPYNAHRNCSQRYTLMSRRRRTLAPKANIDVVVASHNSAAGKGQGPSCRKKNNYRGVRILERAWARSPAIHSGIAAPKAHSGAQGEHRRRGRSRR